MKPAIWSHRTYSRGVIWEKCLSDINCHAQIIVIQLLWNLYSFESVFCGLYKNTIKSGGIPHRFFRYGWKYITKWVFFSRDTKSPNGPWIALSKLLSRLVIPPLHRSCDLSASIVRPQNWPGRRWRQKGGRTVALVVQWWYTGRSDIAMDPMVAIKFWACSKQSHKGRRGGRSLTGRSKEAGGRHTNRRGGRTDAQWSAIGRPVKNTYCCEHCVSIWATLLPSLYHNCASFGRPIASIERSQRRPLCLHSATTATLQPPWQWFCLHSAFSVQPVAPLQQLWSLKEGTRIVLQQLTQKQNILG